MMRLGGTDDRRGDERLVRHPGQGDLRFRHASLCGNLCDSLDYLAIRAFGPGIKRLAKLVRLCPIARLFPITCQTTTRQWAPRYHADSFRRTERHHLTLL